MTDTITADRRPREMIEEYIDPTDNERKIRLNLHEGQVKAINSQARYTAVIAGTQSGKTSFGPWWLLTEIKERGPGDYMVVTPTYKLLELKALPAFLEVFVEFFRLGAYNSGAKKFVFSPEAVQRFVDDPDLPEWTNPKAKVTVFFGHASNPDSLESATAKGAWLDEAGQKVFKLDSWRAIQRRLRLHRGRVLFSTTPYNLGWLKQQVWDRAKAEELAGIPEDERNYLIVNFSSLMNPLFDREEYEEAREEMPSWQFKMFYDGIFTRPAGLIYDAYEEDKHLLDPFEIPPNWEHYLGMDFGGVNTAGVFLARAPGSTEYIAYREYLHGGRTAKQHVEYLISEGKYWGEYKKQPFTAGGAKSEDQWRNEFRDGGLYIREPRINDVEVGISRTYGAFKTMQLYVFSNLGRLREELATYSRELDEESNEPTEKIADKEMYHELDALRYIASEVIARKAGPISSRGQGIGSVSDPFRDYGSADPFKGYTVNTR